MRGVSFQQKQNVRNPLSVFTFGATPRAGSETTSQSIPHAGTCLVWPLVQIAGAAPEREIALHQAQETADFRYPGKSAKVGSTILLPVPGDHNSRKTFPGYLDVGIALAHFQFHVEKGLILFDELRLGDERLRLGFRTDRGNVGYRIHKFTQSRRGVSCAPEVGSHSLPQRLGFSHVKDISRLIVHEIDAGTIRKCPYSFEQFLPFHAACSILPGKFSKCHCRSTCRAAWFSSTGFSFPL
jgi:hypothetical protein